MNGKRKEKTRKDSKGREIKLPKELRSTMLEDQSPTPEGVGMSREGYGQQVDKEV